MSTIVNVFSLNPEQSMEKTGIGILHFSCTREEGQTDAPVFLLRAKAVNRYNFVNRVSMTVRESDGAVLESSCPCKEAAMIQPRLCCHCSALAEYYLKNPAASCLTQNPDCISAEQTGEEQAASTQELSFSHPVQDGGSDDAASDNSEESEPSPLPQDDPDDSEALPGASFSDYKEPVLTVNAEPRSMEIVLGNRTDNGEPLIWYPNDTHKLLHTNMGIIGTMGTGKTQFTKSVVAQLYRQQQNNLYGSPLGILIFDYKGDYNESKTDFIEAVNARVLKPYRLPFNPFVLSSDGKFIPRLPIHRASMIRDTFTKSFHLGDVQQSTLIDTIVHAYAAAGIDPDVPETWKKPAPTFAQVFEQFEKETSGKANDSLSNVMKMIQQFGMFEPDPSKAYALTDLLRGVVVIDLSGYDEKLQHLVVAITLDLFYSQMHALGSSRIDGQYRQMNYFILVDEADHFMRQRFASLEKIMKEGREFGVGTILSTQSLHHFYGSSHDDYAQYILTWDIHNVKDLKQREVEYLLSREQSSADTAAMQNYIKNQKKHESVVMLTEAGSVSPFPINDRAFWQLNQEWKQEATGGTAE